MLLKRGLTLRLYLLVNGVRSLQHRRCQCCARLWLTVHTSHPG